MHIVPYEQVQRVKWKGNSLDYDWALHALDRKQHDQFLVISPDPKNQNLHHYIDDYDIGDGKTCIVWNHQGSWVAKLFPKDWEIGSYHDINIEMPILKWEKNPNISLSVEFDFNPMLSFVPKPQDASYELIWHVKDQDVWAFRCSAENKVSKGVKDMGELTPALPQHLDVMHIVPYEQVKQVKWKGDSIDYDWELHALDQRSHDQFLVVNFNFVKSDLDNFNYLDFADNKRNCIVWCYKDNWMAKLFPKNWIIGNYKFIHIEKLNLKLKWERNPNISSSIEFENDPRLTFFPEQWDFNYELIWHVKDQDVWAFKCWVEGRIPNNVKDIGELTPLTSSIPVQLDVIFISYKESNAEENWQRVLEKAPWAQRVDKIEGIFNAHKAASKLATTDMFYVVDGDAWLVDDFNFDFQPDMFHIDCTHIWRARNPINKLAYGYGGVKLFSKRIIDDTISWTTLDMSTTISPKLKIVNKISNITAFNTDEFSTWRSAFRECVKLSYNIHQDPSDNDSIYRLEGWMSPSNQPFAQYAIDAAHEAREWVQQNSDSLDKLLYVNNRNWIETQFKLRNTND